MNKPISLTGRQVRILLDQLCIDMGFCLPPDEHARLCADPPGSVIALTDAIFVAEGLDPEMADKRLYRQVRDRVVAAEDRNGNIDT